MNTALDTFRKAGEIPTLHVDMATDIPKSVLACLLSLVVAGCAASEGGHANATRSELLGVDADANGIRDDVDAQIRSKFADQPIFLEQAQVIAREYQTQLSLDLSKISDAKSVLVHEAHVGACVAGTLIKNGLEVHGDSISSYVYSWTFESRARIDHRQQLKRQAGGLAIKSPEKCPVPPLSAP